jgi:hypothetical protein
MNDIFKQFSLLHVPLQNIQIPLVFSYAWPICERTRAFLERVLPYFVLKASPWSAFQNNQRGGNATGHVLRQNRVRCNLISPASLHFI